jgi:hypothetical protein
MSRFETQNLPPCLRHVPPMRRVSSNILALRGATLRVFNHDLHSRDASARVFRFFLHSIVLRRFRHTAYKSIREYV